MSGPSHVCHVCGRKRRLHLLTWVEAVTWACTARIGCQLQAARNTSNPTRGEK